MDHHRNMTGCSCDIDLAIRVLKIGIFCADHGYWDPNETFVHFDANITSDINHTQSSQKLI